MYIYDVYLYKIVCVFKTLNGIEFEIFNSFIAISILRKRVHVKVLQ